MEQCTCTSTTNPE